MVAPAASIHISRCLSGPALTMLMIETADMYSRLITCLELCLLSAASDCQKPSEDKGPRTQLGSAKDEMQKQSLPLLYSVHAYGGKQILSQEP